MFSFMRRRQLIVYGLLWSMFFALPKEADAQQQPPEIKYILPDVCAPNMSVYVEFFAATWDTTAFGKDGLYLNNPNDAVRVELARPADSTKVVIGPVIVSWNGRLISTQVFVLPNVRPNAQYWNNLTSEFRIPLRVVVSGRADSVSNADTLYIVQPYTDASQITRTTNNNPDSIMIGEIRGPDGEPQSVRSRRGALVVNNLTLEGRGGGNTTRRYVVSTVDCDAVADGNQGFLPFVMLASGTIDGGGAILSANGVGKQGGAGGGGGGGQVCDSPFPSNPRMSGGDGFTGGSAGGQNNSTAPREQQWSFLSGKGTGVNAFTPQTPVLAQNPNVLKTTGGNSLNDVIGGTSRGSIQDNPEASGGGTGHPFGTSGYYDARNAADQTAAESAGGGVGRLNRIAGDGAGFGTTGYSQALNGFSGGQRHGNDAVMPIAGGSGGASGNPQGGCSGEGGGGGGALRISASTLTNLTIEARGALGLRGNPVPIIDGPPVNGGAGSGGHIAVHSRTRARNLRINVLGGDATRDIYSGAGRIRYDTPNRIGNETDTSIVPSESGGMYRSYTGITLDTKTEVISPYTIPVSLSGYGGAAGGVRFFRRTLNGRWEQRGDSVQLGGSGGFGLNSVLSSDNSFVPITTRPRVEQDSLLFIVTVQRSFMPNPRDKEFVPEWIMSQSGTNMVRVVPLPFIETSVAAGQPFVFPTLERCGLERRTIEGIVKIYNRRGGTLRIDSVRVLSPYFRMDTVDRPRFIPKKGDSVMVRLRFIATAAIPADSLVLRTTLQIFHNDTIPDVGEGSRPNPINIALQAPLKTILFNLQPDINSNSIDFGDVAIGSSRDTIITIRNASRDAVRYAVSARSPIASAPFIFAERSLTSDSIQVRIRFQPTAQGAAAPQTAIVRVQGVGICASDTASYQFTLTGVGTRPQLDIPNTDSLIRFGTIAPICFPDTATARAQFKIASAGNSLLTVSVRMASTASFFVLSPTMFTMMPNNEQQVQVRFTASPSTQATTTYRDTVIITTNDARPEARTRRIPILLEVQSNFARVNIVPQDMVRFGAVRFFNAVTRSVQVTNIGNTPVTVNIAALRAPYRIVQPAQRLLQLAPGARDSIVIELLPSDAQMPDVPVREILRLSYTNIAAPCTLKLDTLPLLGTPTGPIAMQARIWLDTLRSVNMLRDTSIRVWGQVLGTAIDRSDNFRAALRVRRGMFYPRSQALSSPFGTPTLDSNRADSLDRFFVMTVPNVRLTNTPTVIATIGGTPILTDTMRSGVEWVQSQTRWGRRDSVYQVEAGNFGNGLLVMNVVLQGANNTPRLPNNAITRKSTRLIAVYPTPVREELSIQALLGQNGTYSVQVVTMLGNRLLAQDWKQNNAQSSPNEASTLTISLKSIPSGVYGIVLTTPSGERESVLITVEK